MPLMQSKSKKAFADNVASEINAGKPQDQSLAIAYDVKRRASKKKKLASGGTVESGSPTMNYADGGPVSASNEKRPMPGSLANSAKMARMNSGDKPASQDKWTDSPTVAQARKPSRVPLSRPRIAGNGDSFSVRDRDLLDKEREQMEAFAPGEYSEQPSKALDEKDPMKMGPSANDHDEVQHNNGKRAYAKGGMINEVVSMNDAEEDELEHPAGLSSDNSSMRPKGYMDEHDPNQYAEGGAITHEMMMQPEPEAEEEHADSIAAAIMAKRRKYADGGHVDIDSNNEEQPNGYYARNEDAALKENYDKDMDGISQPYDSNLIGDEREADDGDSHDMVGRIRSKMAMKRSFR